MKPAPRQPSRAGASPPGRRRPQAVGGAHTHQRKLAAKHRVAPPAIPPRPVWSSPSASTPTAAASAWQRAGAQRGRDLPSRPAPALRDLTVSSSVRLARRWNSSRRASGRIASHAVRAPERRAVGNAADPAGPSANRYPSLVLTRTGVSLRGSAATPRAGPRRDRFGGSHRIASACASVVPSRDLGSARSDARGERGGAAVVEVSATGLTQRCRAERLCPAALARL